MTVALTSTEGRSALSFSRILSFIGSLVVLRVIVKLGGFGEKVVLAHYFELDTALDAFTAAVSVPMMFFFTVSGIATPTILPMFVRRLQSEEQTRAWSQWHAWLLVLLILLCSAAFVCYLLVERLAWILAPGFDWERHALCVTLLRIMIPLSVVMGLYPIFTIALNAQRRFLFPPASELALKAATIVAVIAFAPKSGISAAGWGTVAGALLALLVCTLGILPSWRRNATFPRFHDPEFKAVSWLMMAPVLGAVSSRLGNVVETAASSTLVPGSVAALSFAWKVVNMPLLIIPLASGTVLFTLFAEMNQRGEHESAGRMLAAGTRAMLFIFVPLTVFTCVLSRPIVAFIYERGVFGAESTAQVAAVLFWLAPVMCALSVETLITGHFFSRADVWPPVLLGIAGVALRCLLIVVCIQPWGLAGLALAIVISRFTKVLALMVLVAIRGKVSVDQFKIAQMLRFSAAAFIAGIAVYCFEKAVGTCMNTSFSCRMALLAAAGAGGTFVYLGCAYLLGSEECHYVVRSLQQRVLRQHRSV